MKGMIRNEIKVQNDKKNVENDETRSKKNVQKKSSNKKVQKQKFKKWSFIQFFSNI